MSKRWFLNLKFAGLRGMFCWAMLLWTAVVAASLLLTWRQQEKAVFDLATIEARSSFNKDLVYRHWATMHGGVYVPPTEATPPNPYLSHLAERDVVTTDGKHLTLVNPAYMTRQAYELGESQYGLRGHLTSLNPLSPSNHPDNWERTALLAFESGVREISSVEMLDGAPFLRFMRPMITEAGCLKCHAAQGYLEGDIRGGISVSVSFAPFQATARTQQLWMTTVHGFIGMLGLFGIWFGGRSVSRSQSSLREERKQLELALSGGDLGTWDWDLPSGRITFNERFAEMLGDRLLAKITQISEFRALVHPEDLDRVETAMNEHLAGKTVTYEIEHRVWHQSGHWVWVLDRGRVLEHDGKHAPRRACGTLLDITGRKMAEDGLRKSEERFRALFDNSPDAVFLTVPDGTITTANLSAVTMFGWSEQEFKQMDRSVLLDRDDPRLAEALQERQQTGRVKGVELTAINKDGNKFPVEVDSVILSGEPLRSFVTMRDITHRKQAEKERLELESQFRHSQKIESVGRLAGGIAHDYNNMLSVIIGRAELAKMRSLDSTSLPDDLDQILQAAMRSRDITQQLLAFARKQIIFPRVLDLNETVESMLAMLRQLLGEDIDLAWRPKEGLWPVELDPSQMDQILANLCINARDAIDDVGKMTIETRMVSLDQAYCRDHSGFVPGDFVMLAVSDDGCGMDKETLDKIFEPFFTTKPTGKGTGLGLSMVYGIVKQHNGFINVYSEPGEGTTFKIYLPRHKGQIAEECGAIGGELLKGQGETVLVVEDEASILALIEEMLSDFGYKVLAANSPAEALELANVYPGEIHLLITDVVMPGMNGRVLAGRLQSMRPQLKCLYMSGYTADVIAHHGVLDEGIHFIQKPFSGIDFSVHIRTALGL
ncbi:MAG: PAS domain S-box protein [Desulfuromonadales bacterium]